MPTKHVLLIGIDGVRIDSLRVAVNSGKADNIKYLMGHGRFNLKTQSLRQTMSVPCWYSILTGSLHHRILDNDLQMLEGGPIHTPHIQHVLSKQFPNAKTASVTAWPYHYDYMLYGKNGGNHSPDYKNVHDRFITLAEGEPTNLSAKLRKSMSDAAIAAAKAINYVGAGTIEFLVENNQFYFMEMNTRLQVEHPVTEKVTGYDLVEWQLRVAAGEKLPVKQSDIKINGHAIESRIYAEDPSNNFLPSIGHIAYLNTPKTNDDIRIDAGVQSGDDITPFYDPMIAKLITFAPDRETALHKLQKCLSEFHVVGINTNISFLNEITKHTAFQTAKYDTKFVDAHAAALTPRGELSIEIKLLACLFVLSQQEQAMHTQALASKESNSPWLMSHNWRLNLSTSQQINLFENENNLQFKVNKLADLYQISFDDKIYHASATMTENLIQATIGGESIHATIVEYQKEIHLFVNEFHHVLNRFDPDTYYQQAEAGSGHLNAPLPGTVVAVMTKKGKKVTAGDSLIVLEAMKMEHTIHAPAEGTIKEIYFNVGDLVNEGEELIRIE